MKDYYKTLGIKNDATRDEIKKSFRKLARKHHPDKNAGNENHSERFKEINEAYQTLSNKESRSEYDFMLSGAGFGRSQHDFFGGFNDLFGDIFGRARHQTRQKREPTIRITATITELMSGKTQRSFKMVDEIVCDPCGGVGGESKQSCNNCKGTGKITKTSRQGSIAFKSSVPCNLCHSSGYTILNVCRVCLGNGFTKKEELFDVFITCKQR
ncbi:MAG TPA: J domain-containing protein [Nitrospinaceae bacterium]|jgi:molecular chaperone DnaJ|nr:J domain-containing protein [Nitrospinaceae bacterium]